jgi:hypothetical protein
MHQSHTEPQKLEITDSQCSRAILKQFATQQEQLVKGMLSAFPNFSDWEYLIGFPLRDLQRIKRASFNELE